MNRRLSILSTVLIMFLCSMFLLLPQTAYCVLSVTCDISGVDDTLRMYTYTLAFDDDPSLLLEIWGFSLYMPEAGAKAVTGFSCSDPSWDAEIGGSGAYSYWVMGGNPLRPGESVQLQLTTPASVQTIYNYTYGTTTSNWDYALWSWDDEGSGHGWVIAGDTTLPVPGGVVPEPSSLLALLCGIGGLGGMWLRRRK